MRLFNWPGTGTWCLDAGHGAVVLRGVRGEVRGERGRADGRVLPPAQRLLAYWRFVHFACGAAGRGPVLADLGAAAQIRFPAALAVEDDAAADKGEDDDEAADGDACDCSGV